MSESTNIWDKWLQATGIDDGYGYRVPEEVWNAAWRGRWPEDKQTIQWIIEKYLDVEQAKLGGYVELVHSLRQEAEAALKSVEIPAAEQRRLKIDAEIEEAIKTIQALGRDSDFPPVARPLKLSMCTDKPRHKRDRRSAIAIIMMALVFTAGFVGGYESCLVNRRARIAVSCSPEIRRAIPVEPEVRRAVPVKPEIRRAILVGHKR